MSNFTSHNVIIFAGTELPMCHWGAELELVDFNVYRSDCDCYSGNTDQRYEVLVAVRKDIKAWNVPCVITSFNQLFVSLKFGKGTLVVGGSYILSSSGVTFYEDFYNPVESVLSTVELIVCGDYNIRKPVWDNDDLA